LLMTSLSPQRAAAEIQSRPVEYTAGGIQAQAVLYYDDTVQDKRPGVLVVHEWWGLNDYAKRRAKMLAEAGYVALAVDMYGQGRTTEHPSEAGEFAQAVFQNFPAAKERFEAALAELESDPRVDPERVAAIGYCFGGGIVLNMARQGVDLDAVVSFHGSLGPVQPAKEGKIRASILVCHGAADPMAGWDAVTAFEKEMSQAGADYTLMIFGGAKHSFTSPEADERGMDGLAYDPEADRLSWAAMLDFLELHLP